MIIPDVNVLVHSYRREDPRHAECSRWLKRVLDSDESLGLSDVTLSGFARVVTNAKMTKEPAPIGRALDFVKVLRRRPNAVRVTPGERHWAIFDRLCREADARGPLVQDAFHAALAVEWGAELITFDRDFERFPGLRWRPPFRTD